MTSHLSSRETLRRQLRQTRRSLSELEQQEAAFALVQGYQSLLKKLTITSPKRIALYLSNDGEISPHYLCELFWQQGMEVYLPIVDGKQLKFALYTVNTCWQDNIFGIKEPITTEYLSANQLDIVFLPLVGFDSKGGRLGMGGGFYDRTFEDKRADFAPLLIGLAHDCQEVKSLPVESWDVPLQGILTPKQIILV